MIQSRTNQVCFEAVDDGRLQKKERLSGTMFIYYWQQQLSHMKTHLITLCQLQGGSVIGKSKTANAWQDFW